MMQKMINLGLFSATKNQKLACYALAKRLDQSMTSNPQFRAFIKNVKESYDTVMINHDLVMLEEKRIEEIREEENIIIVSPKGLRFIKPTIEEIKTEIQAKNYNVDAETFYHFYESNGWHVGNKKMKSWQSALVTWHRKSKTYLSPKQAQYDRSTNESSRSYIVADENTF